MEKNEKLVTKDFITVGIYSAIYLVGIILASITNLTPYTYLLYPPACALINGVVFMLLITKVPKKGIVILLGVIVALFFCSTGYEGMIVAISIVIFAVLAQVIITLKNSKSFKLNTLGYMVFSCGIVSSNFRLFLFTEEYLAQQVEKGLNSSFAEQLMGYTSYGYWFLTLVITLIAALSGAYVAKSLLKKHFERAGIV